MSPIDIFFQQCLRVVSIVIGAVDRIISVNDQMDIIRDVTNRVNSSANSTLYIRRATIRLLLVFHSKISNTVIDIYSCGPFSFTYKRFLRTK